MPSLLQVTALTVALTFCIYLLNFLHYGIKEPKVWWFGLLWLMGGGLFVDQLVSSRNQNLSNIERYVESIETASTLSVVLGQALRLGVIGLAVLIIAFLLLRNFRFVRPGFPLWLGTVSFGFGPIIASVLGHQPAFNYSLFVFPMATTIFYFLPRVSTPWLFNQLKLILAVFIYGSLISAVVVPEWAFLLNYNSGVIPGLTVRLFGLSSHANMLGPLAVLMMTLEWLYPAKNRALRWLNYGVAFSVLLLTQSKTAWLIFAILFFLQLFLRFWFDRNRSVGRSLALVFLAVAMIGLLTSFMTITGQLSDDELRSLTTFTGRTALWTVSLETWQKYPLFGYGPSIWDLDFRLQLGQEFLFAGQAHNQFLQSLSEAGLVGALGLLVFYLMLWRYGFRYAQFTRGASLGIVVFLFVGSLTESSFRTYSVNTTFLTLIVCYLALLGVERQALEAAEPEPVLSHE